MTHQTLPTTASAEAADRGTTPGHRDFAKWRLGLILGALVVGVIGVLGLGFRSGLFGQ